METNRIFPEYQAELIRMHQIQHQVQFNKIKY